MAELYRERASLTHPPGVVAGRLARRYGDPVEGERTGERDRWSATGAGGLYTYRVTLDRTRGDLRTVVATPVPYRLLSLGTAALVVAALAGVLPPRVALLGAWTCVALTVFPVGHLLPGVDRRPEIGAGGDTVGHRLTPDAALPFVGAVACQWAALRPSQPAVLVDAMAAVFLAVGAGVFYATGGVRSGLAAPRVSALVVPLSGLLPALLSAGNLVLAGAVLLDKVASLADVALLVACAAAFTGAFFGYCRLTLDGVTGARLAPLGSAAGRAAGLVLYLGINAVVLAGVVVAVWLLSRGAIGPRGAGPFGALGPAYATLDAALSPLPLLPARTYSLAVSAVLVAPLLTVAAGWAYYLVAGTAARVGARLAGERIEPPGVPDGTAVVAVDSDAPVVRSVGVALGLYRFVVVSEAVRAALAEDELAAVLAHEAYHLRSRDLPSGTLAAVAALAFGGRNSLLAFYDYPEAERRADDHAAARVGADPLIRALRRLESLRASSANARSGSRIGRLLRAPYGLFFGSVLLDRARPSVDERVGRLADRQARAGDGVPAGSPVVREGG